MSFEIGKSYKTLGGWEAKVIWKNKGMLYVIHKPNTEEEKGPIFQMYDGSYDYANFSVNEAPHYNIHPANLTIEEWENDKETLV